MSSEDVTAIHEIELQSYSPWSKASLLSELERVGGTQLVAKNYDGTIVGWCCASQISSEAELFKIATRQQEKRAGVATLLLSHLEADLRSQGATDIFLEVRSKNRAAIKFYFKFDFFEVGLRKDYYSSPEDDAVNLKKSL